MNSDEKEDALLTAAREQIEFKYSTRENDRRIGEWRYMQAVGQQVVQKYNVKMLGNELLRSFSGVHKPQGDLTWSMREELMHSEGTELYGKNMLAKVLVKKVNSVKDKAARGRRQLGFDLRTSLSDQKLRAASAFFVDDMEQNADLVRRLSGKGTALDGAGSTQKDKRAVKDTAMDYLTKRFLSLTADGIDLSDDMALAANAGKLEELYAKLQGYKTLFDGDREYQEKLKNMKVDAVVEYNKNISGSYETNMLEQVKRQMDSLGFLTDHYRARKLLMTDPYYLSHVNEEIGKNAGEKSDREQKKVSELIKAVKDTADNYQRLQGGYRAVDGTWLNKAGSWLSEGSSPRLESLEQEHKTRAYADGRMDLNRITKGGMKNLMKEVVDFRKKYGNRGYNIKRDWAEIKELTKGYSPQFQHFMEGAFRSQSDAFMKTYANEMSHGLYDKLAEMAKGGEASCISSMDILLPFKDPASGESFVYSSQISRDYTCLATATDGQMSEEEVLELFEGLNAGQRKDIDLSDPDKASAAKELYLQSMAKVHQLFFDQQQRYLRTCGFLSIQLPPLALVLAAGEGAKDLAMRYYMSIATDNMVNDKRTVINGQKVSLLDTLVAKGYLTAEYVSKAKESTKAMATISTATQKAFGIYSDYATTPDDNLKFHSFEVGDARFYNMANESRGKVDGPCISSAKVEKDYWKVFNQATAEAGVSEQCSGMLEANIKAMNAASRYTRSMIQLKRFVVALKSVDTGGHSKKYYTFAGAFDALTDKLSEISKKCPPDGKNLDPQSMIELRGAYDRAIKASKTYLSGKNRTHRNALYRRRYDVVDELIREMESDYKVLSLKGIDQNYSLAEALDESREVQAEVFEADTKELHGAVSHRKAFDMTVGNEVKRMVFTKETNLEKKLGKKNPYKDFYGGKLGWMRFPQLAKLTEIKGGREALEEFFESGTPLDYLNALHSEKGATRRLKDGFAKDFEEHLGKLWEKFGTKLKEIAPDLFPQDDKQSLPAVYKAMEKDAKENILKNLADIGVKWIDDVLLIATHKFAGIQLGANLEKRNVAMSIMAKELDTKTIAYSAIGSIRFQEGEKKDKKGAGEEKQGDRGILMEYVEGLDMYKVQKGFQNGTIIADNEAAILEQLSELMVTDYLCGNVDRHEGNFICKMENTGRIHEKTKKPIQRIVQIVGIDNDMSFGNLPASELTEHRKSMSIPETIQLISRGMADRILALDRSRLFLKLGGTVTEQEKEAMWTRVEHMKLAIMDALTPGKQRGLTIVEEGGFDQYSLKDLANSNLETRSLIRRFEKMTDNFGRNKDHSRDRDKEAVPHRLPVKEVRLDIFLSKKKLIKDKEVAFIDALEVNEDILDLSKKERQRKFAPTDDQEKDPSKAVGLLKRAAKDFEDTIGRMFSKMSTDDLYGIGLDHYSADLFSNAYAKSHGINSILDIFYINGKRAAEALPEIEETVEAILKNPDLAAMVMDKPKGQKVEVSEKARASVRDLVGIAFIAAVFMRGEKQVTIANYQKKPDGSDELVITDLNAVIMNPNKFDTAKRKMAGSKDDSKLIVKSRKDREKRFAEIQADMEKRQQERN